MRACVVVVGARAHAHVSGCARACTWVCGFARVWLCVCLGACLYAPAPARVPRVFGRTHARVWGSAGYRATVRVAAGLLWLALRRSEPPAEMPFAAVRVKIASVAVSGWDGQPNRCLRLTLIGLCMPLFGNSYPCRILRTTVGLIVPFPAARRVSRALPSAHSRPPNAVALCDHTVLCAMCRHQRRPRTCGQPSAAAAAARTPPRPHRDRARPCHVCTGSGPNPAHICTRTGFNPAHICNGTALAPAASAPGPGSLLPHLHRDSAHPSHICPGTGLTPPTSGPG